MERIVVLALRVVIFDDGKTDLAENALELRLLEHLFEELGHMTGWVGKGPTAKGTKDESALTIVVGNAQNGTNQMERTGNELIGDGSLPMCYGPSEVNGCHGHEIGLPRLIQQGIAISLLVAEDGYAMGKDSTKVVIERIGMGGVMGDTILLFAIERPGTGILIQEAEIVGAAEQILFLRPCTSMYATARIQIARHVEHTEVVSSIVHM